MFRLKIICPKCKVVNYYTFGSGNLIRIGDYLSNEESIFQSESYIREHKQSCSSCKNEFKILEIVHEGRFINVLINPTKKEESLLDKGSLPILEEYLGGYNFDDRKEMLLGEDSEFIPAQISANYIMKPNDYICVFDEMWKVAECYKVLWSSGKISARIYKVKNDKDIERLLVLRDGYMPSLKVPNWDGKIETVDDCFCKYSIPIGCEIIMELN